MPEIVFTRALERHVPVPARKVGGATVREALLEALGGDGRLRGYLFDDQGLLRRHVVVFVDGEAVHDRQGLGDPVAPGSRIFVMQALTGG
ncbi:MAG TPA: MoaD/ThiS family protein [Anaeromyxobacteraceae bacterium]|nr:MoaD/ThiS family protein [Anaeromyxobacteraceae bacterium]